VHWLLGGPGLAVIQVLGGELAWCAEIGPHCRKIVAACFEGAPNLCRITAVDWADVSQLDIITAGWPCQDISLAGQGARIKEEPAVARGSASPPASARCGPAPYSWRTWPPCAPGAWPVSWQTLPPRGYDANRRPDARATWMPRTLRPACSSWPPARYPLGNLAAAAYPQARDHHGAQLPELHHAAGHQVNLNDAAIGLAGTGGTTGGWYEQVIRRWEAITGRAAPFPAERSGRGTPRLSAVFAEWLMQVPRWVTAVPGPPSCAQIRASGNGLVPRPAGAVPGARGPADLTGPHQVNIDAGGPGRKASLACTPAAPGPCGRPAPTVAARAPQRRAEGQPGAVPVAANPDPPCRRRRAA
jgi:DNA (cytosine-5)-methyltransferase 1